MEDATCRSSTHSLQKAKRIYHGPKIGATNLEAGLYTNFSIVEPILGSRIWPLFWGHKTQTGASQYGQQVCYCRRKLTAAHTRDTVCVYIYIERERHTLGIHGNTTTYHPLHPTSH